MTACPPLVGLSASAGMQHPALPQKNIVFEKAIDVG